METHASASCCWCHAPLVKLHDVWWCPTRACAQRQLRYATYTSAHSKVTRYLYVPAPIQTVWHEAVYDSSYRRILAGGAAGPGKSRWMRETLYLLARQVPGLHALLLRRTYNDLNQSHLRFMADEVEQRGGKFTKGPPAYATFKHQGEPDAIIRAGHLEDDASVQNYLSAEYDVIAPDELVTFERDSMLELFTRARTTNPHMIALRGDPAQDYDGALVISATNPGGRGGAWVKDFFIDHAPDVDEFPLYTPNQWAFFPAFLRDNPYIKAGGYEQSLSGLRESRRRQLLDGDWAVYEGQFFSEFRAKLHIRDIGPVNPDWKHTLSLDWGFNSPGVALWWVQLPDGHYHIRGEYKFNASLSERLTIRDVAQEIVARSCRAFGLTKTPICFFDPDLYKFKGQIAESPVETFARWGVPAAAKPEHKRIHGWTRVREMLRVAPDGVPWLTMDPSCHYGIRTVPMVQQDKHDPEDVADGNDDHWVDALRFGAVGQTAFRATKPHKAAPAPMTTAWWRTAKPQTRHYGK